MKYVFSTFHNGKMIIPRWKWLFIIISNGIYQAIFFHDGQHIKNEWYCLQQICPSSIMWYMRPVVWPVFIHDIGSNTTKSFP